MIKHHYQDDNDVRCGTSTSGWDKAVLATLLC